MTVHLQNLIRRARRGDVGLRVRDGHVESLGALTDAEVTAIQADAFVTTALIMLDGDLVDLRQVDRAPRRVEGDDDRPTLGQVAVWLGDMTQAELDDLVGRDAGRAS
jgi:hypothetical protein